MEDLITQLKKEIIEALNLEEMTPADIDAEAPLCSGAHCAHGEKIWHQTRQCRPGKGNL